MPPSATVAIEPSFLQNLDAPHLRGMTGKGLNGKRLNSKP